MSTKRRRGLMAAQPDARTALATRADDSIPLGYELQTRWQMHVMGAPVCHVVALVAGRGLCHYPIPRDMDTEVELVRQVEAWWQCHIIDGVEPPLSGRDTSMIAALWQSLKGGED